MDVTWELAWPPGTLALFLALIWGFLRYRTRSPREKAITETATREQYKRSDTYQATTRDDLACEAEKEQARRKDAERLP